MNNVNTNREARDARFEQESETLAVMKYELTREYLSEIYTSVTNLVASFNNMTASYLGGPLTLVSKTNIDTIPDSLLRLVLPKIKIVEASLAQTISDFEKEIVLNPHDPEKGLTGNAGELASTIVSLIASANSIMGKDMKERVRVAGKNTFRMRGTDTYGFDKASNKAIKEGGVIVSSGEFGVGKTGYLHTLMLGTPTDYMDILIVNAQIRMAGTGEAIVLKCNGYKFYLAWDCVGAYSDSDKRVLSIRTEGTISYEEASEIFTYENLINMIAMSYRVKLHAVA